MVQFFIRPLGFTHQKECSYYICIYVGYSNILFPTILMNPPNSYSSYSKWWIHQVAIPSIPAWGPPLLGGRREETKPFRPRTPRRCREKRYPWSSMAGTSPREKWRFGGEKHRKTHGKIWDIHGNPWKFGQIIEDQRKTIRDMELSWVMGVPSNHHPF